MKNQNKKNGFSSTQKVIWGIAIAFIIPKAIEKESILFVSYEH